MDDTDQPVNEAMVQIPKKKSVIFIFLLSIVTFGVYCPIWYLKRSPELNNLQTQTKSKKGFAIFALVIHLLLLGSIIGLFVDASLEGINSINPDEVPLIFIILSFASLGLILINILIFIVLSFKARKILNESLLNKGVQNKISGFYTLFLNYYYLQYEINRIIKDTESKKRIGPLITFLVIYIVIPICFAIYYY